MNAASAQQAATGTEWFASWFDSAHYHRLYAHRDEREAAQLVERLVQRLRATVSGPGESLTALDLGCGAGRHSRKLASLGLTVTGLDLSAESIREARRSEHEHLRFLRGDMRRPFGRRAFDFVFSLFTSFGYFEEPADHLKVVRNIARSLKPGGALVLDYMNARFAQDHLESQDVVERDGVVYRLSRWADARHIYKKIVIDDSASIKPLEYIERVAKFSLGDFRFMFGLFGMSIEDAYGDYALNPFDPRTSPRLLMVVRKDRHGRVLLSRQLTANTADRLRRHAEIGREHRLRHAIDDGGVGFHEFDIPFFG
jgi:SAM-dependent methyltransferase